jgi:hypothetical protein
MEPRYHVIRGNVKLSVRHDFYPVQRHVDRPEKVTQSTMLTRRAIVKYSNGLSRVI